MPNVLALRTAGRLLLGLSAAVLLGGGLAIAQMVPNASPRAGVSSSAGSQAMRNLNLSRDQVQQLQSVMEDYKSSFEAVLTEEQLAKLEELRADQTGQSDAGNAQEWLAQLDLSDSQEAQLSTLSEVMMAKFETIFTAEQLEQLQSIGLVDRL
ncbi:hypothetical protein IQ265_09645 [Nodosilinea sp. LEGE 06152]|uniref:hypothetical protein n=1 Tax=Nodosilinea sp. LEGE 06152 TaxID=2777966 RepID=UPI0018807FAA|nr:hypothetical protein [Nodosilinea sp. LEGE 06152]MBE9157087.1 hypothetical protein [Nodosilinea sp. LEGE 06152]